jgi:hypothetical protein
LAAIQSHRVLHFRLESAHCEPAAARLGSEGDRASHSPLGDMHTLHRFNYFRFFPSAILASSSLVISFEADTFFA